MRPSGPVSPWRVDLALAAVVLLWSLNFVILKAVMPRFEPVALAAVRFGSIAALFEALLRLRGGGERIAPADRRAFALSALAGYTLYQGLFVVGLSQTSAFSTALMINTGPLWAAVILTAARIESITARQWAGVVLALAGLVVYLGPRLVTGAPAGLGDLLGLGAAVSWTVYGILNRPLLGRYSAFFLTTRTFQIGAAGFLPFALPAVLRQDWAGVGWAGWAAVGYSVVFPIVVAVSLWNWAIRQRGVARTVIYQYLVPVASGVLSWVLLGEAFGPWKLAGAALVLVGVALSRRV